MEHFIVVFLGLSVDSDILNERIKTFTENINENKSAITELEKRKGNKYETVSMPMTFIRTDLIILFNQNLAYAKNIIEQVHSNYILFKQGTTKNILDYKNKRVTYLHNQIQIMRSDIQNYMDLPCNCNKSQNSKPKKK